MRHLTLPLALAFTLQLAGAAHGATVGEQQFTAAPGERNDVHVRAVQHGDDPFDLAWTITDRTAPLEASGTCRRVDTHTVSCHGGISMAVALGDRDDAVDFAFVGPADAPPQMWVTVHGGLGDDTLRGGPGVNRLRGGAGDDRLIAGGPRSRSATGDLLFGGPGDDVLRGGPAAEVLRGGGGHDTLRGHGGPDTLVDGDGDHPDADVLDGGVGGDTVSYARRTTGVSVDLVAGSSGEGDSLSRVETAIGGHGDDDLIVVHGVRCGDGIDLVDNQFLARIRLPHDCEMLALRRGNGTASIHPTAVTASAATFALACPGCTPTMRIREAGHRHRVLASGTLTSGAVTVTVTLSPLGHRLAARARGVWATARIGGYYSDGAQPQWSFRLKTPA